MRTARGIVTGVAAAGLAAAALGAATPAEGAGLARSADPAGDAGTGYDMTLVTVANDDRGRISFRVDLPALAALPPDIGVSILLDTDLRGTGEDAIDYAVVWLGGGPALVVPFDRAGAAGAPFIPRSLTGSFEPGALTLSIHRRDLDDTRGFTFGVLVGRSLPDGSLDEANVDVGPVDAGRPYLLRMPTRLRATPARVSPRRPRAGARVRIAMPVRDVTFGAPGDRVVRGRVTCRLTVGGRRVRARGALRAGRALCTARTPAVAAGARLRGTVTYRIGRARVTRAVSARVR